MEHFQPRGWIQPCWLGWNFSPVCNTKLYQNQTRDLQLKFQPRVELDPGLKILSCNRFNPGLKLFMSYSSMRGSDYLLQESKIEAMEPFLLPGINAGNV
jgi:hypothetical protein